MRPKTTEERLERQPGAPLTFIVGSQNAFDGEYSFRPHIHPMGQLYVVLRGTVIHQVENQDFEIKAGHGLWIAPGRLRSPRATTQSGWYVIVNYEVSPGFDPARGLAQRFPLGEDGLREALGLATSIKGGGSATVHRVLFEKFCLSILGEAYYERWERAYGVPVKSLISEHPHIRRAEAMMLANAENPLKVEELARLTGVSRATLGRLFQKYRQQSPAARCLELRLMQARQLIEHSQDSVTQIAMKTGFSSSQHLSTAFKRAFRCSPASLRAKL